jgi:hypothetical protein
MFFNPVGGYQTLTAVRKSSISSNRRQGLQPLTGLPPKNTIFTQNKIQLEVYRIWI